MHARVDYGPSRSVCPSTFRSTAANRLLSLPASPETVPQAVRDLFAYELIEIEHALTQDVGGDAREAALMLEGVTYAACVWLIEQRVARVPGVLSIDINYATRRELVRMGRQVASGVGRPPADRQPYRARARHCCGARRRRHCVQQ